jgi:hypothetical protein
MQTKTITLPLPAIELSPNWKGHWSKKSKQAKLHRSRANWAAMDALGNFDKIESYRLHFFFPDKRKRDADNYSTRCKNYLDGIADRTQQDDSVFIHNGVRREIDRENPRVEIRVVLKEKWNHHDRP